VKRALILASALAAIPIVASAAPKADQSITFSDGSKATTYDHCGDSDLCADVDFPNGDHVAIYSEGAARCQPYVLHFVRTHGATTIYEYSRVINHTPPSGIACGRSLDTQMVMDHGLIHMTVDENTDGTLSVVFSLTKQGQDRSDATAGDNQLR
jgi:hypothetical protein